MPGRRVTTRPKADLRRLARERRAAMSLDLADAGLSIAEHLVALPEVSSAGCVAAYVAYGTEPPTDVLIASLLARDVRVLLPVVLPDLDLDWAEPDGDLVAGLRGTLEPSGPRRGPGAVAAAQVVVVPALSVGLDRRRLGQGGGSYDRALGRTGDSLVVALLWSASEVLDAGALPADEWDRPVDVVVTPEEVIRLARGPG